jgi:hypothetical protein
MEVSERMSEKKEQSGLKSAYELAMARFQPDGPPPTDAQRKALAGVDREAEAKIAEIKIMADQRLAQARAKGDASQVAELERQRAADIEKALSRAESRKKEIRGTH